MTEIGSSSMVQPAGRPPQDLHQLDPPRGVSLDDRLALLVLSAPWFPADVKEWSVRWVLLHLIEETARHGSHAVRESIDGATLFPLLTAAGQWPDPWFQPWQAPTG
ncbi:DUF664 domain-containing protein [Streptomyces sp. NPDC059851]|uniref:mycothiol transferase n=1 Tax=Streptomyces sp. NPDC059851 TaxID=3346971 RepID=UPI003667371A